MLDLELLSRLQFAFTISFHILFPAFSIGLSLFILTIEALWLKTKKTLYQDIAKFFTKIFALTFGMGVVSGIVMEFQLGTNFSGFTYYVGGVLGALFTYEVMTAFFIEAGFLGVMLLGWNRVSPKIHFIATLMVVLGTTLSAYWIMCANTWMQHPVGYHQINGVLEVTNWSAILLNPLLFSRFFHMLIAAYISAGFVISSISAYYLLKNKHLEFAKTCFSLIWKILPVLIISQITIGDLNGEEVLKYQPLKTAAMEGIWNSGNNQAFLVFAIPHPKEQKNTFEIKIPHMASLINTHKWDGYMLGLKSVAPDFQPNIFPVFYGFRIMVGIGFVMLFLAFISFCLHFKKRLFTTSWFLKTCLFSSPLGFIALWSGWITTEMGRQPWIVYDLLKTKDAISHVSLPHVLLGFILIFIVYLIIFGIFYFYYLHQLLTKGPTLSVMDDRPFPYMGQSSSIEN